MEILTECLLKRDIKARTSKGKGILGTVLAFAGADKEQGRKTLHQHWQIWVKELSQTLRNLLFHKNVKIKHKARRSFAESSTKLYVQVMDKKYASLTGVLTRIKYTQ
jgi:hypothetical protein